MKKGFLLIIALFVCITSYGQLFELGPRVAITNSKINFDNGTGISTDDALVGFKAGVYTRLSLLGFYVQPEALFTSTGGKIKVDDPNYNDVIDLTYNRLDVPVMIGKSFAGIFRFNLGPTFSLVLSDDVKDLGTSVVEEVKQDYNDAVIGYQFGIGLDISKLRIDLKYEGNLSKFGESITIPGINQQFETDYRNNMFVLGVAVNLL